jgi:hypothetical protein
MNDSTIGPPVTFSNGLTGNGLGGNQEVLGV